MFNAMQQIFLGTALVFDTVLLVALVERRNWSFVRVPIVAMAAGAWLWHGGQFALLLLTGLPGAWTLQGCCMLAMAAGAMLMPSGLLHGTWRVWRNELGVQSRSHLRFALAYLPMVSLVPSSLWFFAPGRENFDAVTRPFKLPYFLYSGLVNMLAAAVFLRVRDVNLPRARSFFHSLAAVLVGMTALQGLVLFAVSAAWPGAEGFGMLAVTLSPLLPALLLAYFVVRYHFLEIILERSVVYGAILCSTLLFHQLAFQDVSAALPESLRLHIVFLEVLVLAALVLAYPPLRQRTAEALRYLLGIRVSAIRERLRQLAGELSSRAGQPPHDMLHWFVGALEETLRVEYVAGWLFHESGKISIRYGHAQHWTDERACRLFEHLAQANLRACSQRDSSNREIVRCLQAGTASLAVVKTRPHVAGLLVIGRGANNRELGEEETNAVMLLVEQLAITLDNSLLQAKQLAAERKALQDEKLAALGLLASSIAHEVKNPLSAIKTIATVLAEDLGPASPHAEDLRLILGEIERLAATTAQLLEIARPRASPRSPASVPEVLSGTLRLLRHLASQQDIVIESRVADDLPPVQADEHALREIFFNLLSNSLEAAGPGGRVSIHCQRDNGFVVTEVSDSGPGLPEEVRKRLFEPFFTTKQTGNGLGLFVVGRRVGELGGVIHCDSSPNKGTSFTVKLPYQGQHDA